MTIALTATAGAAAVPTASAAEPADLGPYYSIFQHGPAQIPGHDTSWVPQGLAYWPEHDALLMSNYDSAKKKPSMIAIVDRATGKRKKVVYLPTKGHVGGLTTHGKSVFLADGGRVTRFSKRSLTTTPEHGTLKALGSTKVAASSYATVDGDALWVGQYEGRERSTAYRYTLTGHGLSGVKQKIATPAGVQGMTFAGGRVVWSTSGGRNNRSNLRVASTGAPTTDLRTIVAPNMSEGVVVAKGRLYVLYESGSAYYASGNYRVKTIHSAPVGAVVP